jgi:hypothetical protein
MGLSSSEKRQDKTPDAARRSPGSDAFLRHHYPTNFLRGVFAKQNTERRSAVDRNVAHVAAYGSNA